MHRSAVHLKRSDAIDDAALEGKLKRLATGARPLRIGYVGRLHPMKAPLDWIEAVANAVQRLGSSQVEATWCGDGPLLEAARARVRDLGLQACIRFPGPTHDRIKLLAWLRSLDVFAFCHVAAESPRCLLEALVCATPLVGYDSSYAREIVGDRSGAVLVRMHDRADLAAQLVRLARDPASLAELARCAALSRPYYNDEAVFTHRSELIKAHLGE